MKWFQQHSNALYDPKIVKLIKAHGATGFGVYSAINILIAEKERIDLTLEHDIDGLETLLNTTNLKPIIDTCVGLGLFTIQDNLVQNLKIAKYVGNWQQRTKTYVGTTEGLQRPSVQKERSKEVKKEEIKEKKKTLDVEAFYKAKKLDRRTKEEKAYDKLHPMGIGPLALNAIAKTNDHKRFMRNLSKAEVKKLE